jgi:hypothetical protein
MSSPDTIEIRKADPPFDDPEADLILRSSDNIDFYVFKSLLSYSSSVFKDMFCVAQGKPGDDELEDGLQVILTDDRAETWKILLRFMYPSWVTSTPALSSLDEFSTALECSRKYGVAGAEKTITADLIAPCYLKKEPMRVFALACQFGLDAEMRVAAKHTLRIPFLGRPYFVELENMTAATYHQLQEYHLGCGKAAKEVAKNIDWIDSSRFVWFSKHDVCGKKGGFVEIRHHVVSAAKWWTNYMQSAAKALEERPCGLTVLGSNLMDNALRNASLCPKCSLKAFDGMREFGEMFAEEVDGAIEKVSRILFDSSRVLTTLQLLVKVVLNYPRKQVQPISLLQMSRFLNSIRTL